MTYLLIAFLALFSAGVAKGQNADGEMDASERLHQMNDRLREEAQGFKKAPSRDRDDYRIGAEDLLAISVFEVPELSQTARVSAGGEISLPLVGNVEVAGRSPNELESLLTAMLRKSYVKDPQVTVFVQEFHSDPVSVVGAVKAPGLYQIQTHKTLIEILAMAQGFSEGPARLPGREIIVTRKKSKSLGTNAWQTVDVSSREESNPQEGETFRVPIKALLESGDSARNITIIPGDVVKVVPAGTVYVAGDVIRPGAFPLTDFDNISAIQALSMAGGTLKTAGKKNAMVIRRDGEGNRTEEKVNLARVLGGKDPDVMLGPNDILFVPGSVGKAAMLRALETGLQTGTGLLIWGRF